jgi:hypothetical protein
MSERLAAMKAFALSTGLVLLLAGCLVPTEHLENPEEGQQEAFADGWSFQAPGGEFRYEGGKLIGSYEGDQVLLQVRSDQPIDLTGMNWRLEGTLNISEDDSYSRVLAFWEKEDPWPRYWLVNSFIREFAGVRTEAFGEPINAPVHDPQRDIFRFLFGESSGGYYMEFEFPELTLGAGDWRIWLAVPHSSEMNVEIDLPELELSSPVAFGPGCEVIEPSEAEAELMVQTTETSSMVFDALWEFDVPEESALFGAYFGGSRVGVQNAERTFHFPDGDRWEFRQNLAQPAQADPPGWNGGLLASTSEGRHEFHVAHEQSVVSGQPKLVYCIG